jgi:hypothetical protein
MTSKFTELVIDCHDPHAIGVFWSEVLGYRIDEEDDEGCFLKGEHAPGLLFQKVPEGKTVKNRLHIDVNATDRSQEEEVERLVGLGAKRVDIGQGEQTWVVLADPEGNEFCVLRTRVEP